LKNDTQEEILDIVQDLSTRFISLSILRVLLCLFVSFLILFVFISNPTSFMALNGAITVGMNFRGSQRSGVARVCGAANNDNDGP
jgi:hypothetical protein